MDESAVADRDNARDESADAVNDILAGPGRPSRVDQPSNEKESREAEAVTERDRIRAYLRALGALCYEVSGDLRLLPEFIAIIALVPQTIIELAGAKRKKLAA